MSKNAKIILSLTMTVALVFGFVHSIWPESTFSFKRLHIFGFNLLTGGALILYHTEHKLEVSGKVRAYFLLAFLYACFAASRLYIPALVLSVPLFLIVEIVRIRRFSIFPVDFFRKVPVSEKFNQASLLCLSIGIVLASIVILNNEYLKIITYEKLTLDVFFLGYSFPVSLITMSLMFSFMNDRKSVLVTILKEVGFWFVNLGVIVFFGFIILGLLVPEIIVSIVLFITVWMIFFLFITTSPNVQQKNFLVSGIAFLLFTAMTGVFYLFKYYYPSVEQYHDYLLVFHAMVSLYGWNLSGMFIIIRWRDFPLRLNSALAIALHWGIVLVLAPIGIFVTPMAVPAVIAYILLLLIVFAGRPQRTGKNNEVGV